MAMYGTNPPRQQADGSPLLRILSSLAGNGGQRNRPIPRPGFPEPPPEMRPGNQQGGLNLPHLAQVRLQHRFGPGGPSNPGIEPPVTPERPPGPQLPHQVPSPGPVPAPGLGGPPARPVPTAPGILPGYAQPSQSIRNRPPVNRPYIFGNQ